MRRKHLSAVTLTDSQKRKIREEIAAFYLDVRGEEMGIIEQESAVQKDW